MNVNLFDIPHPPGISQAYGGIDHSIGGWLLDVVDNQALQDSPPGGQFHTQLIVQRLEERPT